ncbi:hypothetical protein MASR1M32_12450 [Rhodobacter sp.]
MLSAFRRACKSLAQLVLSRKAAPASLLLSAFALSACVGGAPSTGPTVARGTPVQVALLVPGGSGQATDAAMARQLENAARLAMADLSGVAIDLRVYQTSGTPDSARAMAVKAMDEGQR